MRKNCKYCDREYEYKRPTSLFCSPKCRVNFHLLSKDFIRKLGSEVRGKANLRHYKQVYKKMGISHCIRWIPLYNGWFNMYRRKDCNVKGSNDIVNTCNACNLNVNH